MLGRNFRE